MNKKAQAHPYDVSQRMGYYIVVLMMVSVMFLLFSILAQGAQTTYYKSTFGTDIITLEEYFFTFASVKDPLTGQLYNKVLDYDKLMQYTSTDQGKRDLNRELGVYSQTQPNAIGFEIYYKDGADSLISFTTMNFPASAEIVKIYPVLLETANGQFVGYVKLSFGGVE